MSDDFFDAPAWLLTVHFALLSFAAVGGGVIMLAPDMHRYVVDAHHWITAEQFAAAYAIAQAAPGPNMLFVTLVGWQVAGWAGALGATIAIILPPATLTLVMIRLTKGKSSGQIGRFGRAVKNGLAPLSIGLLVAGGWVLLDAGDAGWRAVLVAALTIVAVMRTKWNPLWLILAGAAAGMLGAPA